MEYVQEHVTTLHALTERTLSAPTDRAAVVVPMTEREYGRLATEHVLGELESVDPANVVVPLRASPERVGHFVDWLDEFDLSLDIVWCDGPRLSELLAEAGLDGVRGKGRDVWLALGRALEERYVVLHDADTASYTDAYVPRLLFPLAHGHQFSKGYYARVEDDRLYGRLFRLFYAPLVRALDERYDAPVIDYLGAFRYALAGEFAATSELAASLRLQRSWGLEVGTLGDAFADAGFAGSAQVDLGRYEHDHRSVSGPTGLADMSDAVADATLRTLADDGVDVDTEAVTAAYRTAADRLIDQYATDAAFNGLAYDRGDEREQVDAYAEAISPIGEDDRLPPWNDAPIDAADVMRAAEADLADATETTVPGVVE